MAIQHDAIATSKSRRRLFSLSTSIPDIIPGLVAQFQGRIVLHSAEILAFDTLAKVLEVDAGWVIEMLSNKGSCQVLVPAKHEGLGNYQIFPTEKGLAGTIRPISVQSKGRAPAIIQVQSCPNGATMF